MLPPAVFDASGNRVMTPLPNFLPVDWGKFGGNFNQTYQMFLDANKGAEARYGSANTRRHVAEQMWNTLNQKRYRGDPLGSEEQWFLKQGYNDIIGGLVQPL